MAAPALPATAAILLAVGLAAGCAGPGGSTGPAAAAQRTAARGAPDRSGVPAAPAVRGTAGPGAQARCASWPAGSTATDLLVTAGSDGRSYCVRPGQTVTVLLSGPRALAGGSGPPRLTGDALAAAPAQVHLPAMPSASYTAVRPGTAVLTLVGLPCRSLRPAYGAAVSSGTECAMRQALRVTIIVT